MKMTKAMRGGVLIALLLILTVSGAAALDMSAGANIGFMPTWTNVEKDILGSTMKVSATQSKLTFGGFFDITYAMIGIDFNTTVGKQAEKTSFGGASSSDDNDASYQSLGIYALGKYPFALAEKISLFPMLGLEYNMLLAASQDGNKVDADQLKEMKMNDLYLLAGVGADFDITEKLYIRPSAIFAVNLTAKDGYLENMDKVFAGGVKINVGVGYKF